MGCTSRNGFLTSKMASSGHHDDEREPDAWTGAGLYRYSPVPVSGGRAGA
jgi:hypothetical protein